MGPSIFTIARVRLTVTSSSVPFVCRSVKPLLGSQVTGTRGRFSSREMNNERLVSRTVVNKVRLVTTSRLVLVSLTVSRLTSEDRQTPMVPKTTRSLQKVSLTRIVSISGFTVRKCQSLPPL